MTNKRFSSVRPGMTMPEMMIAMAIMGVVISGALSVMNTEIKTFTKGSELMGSLQNIRFAAGILEKDLTTVGSGVPSSQPFIIYADSNTIAFNADYATNDPNDVGAVYVDSSAPDRVTTALQKSGRITLPGTSVQYPDTSYFDGVVNSHAETLIFYFRKDSTTTRTDDYLLFRQVNAEAPELVSRNIQHIPNTQFFSYYRKVVPTSGAAYSDSVKTNQLPLRHTMPVHNVVNDTGSVADIDRLRGVRINLLASNGRTGTDERIYRISRVIELPNAGLAVRKTCGDEPMIGSGISFVATAFTVSPGVRHVRLTWNRSTDEGGGEKDVIRYVLWRNSPSGPWVDPYISIPSGQSTYTFVDSNVVQGTTYYYALAAQDCTPALSSLVTAAAVTP